MRFAIIGSNFVVEWFVEAARQCEGLVLQAAYSRTETQARSNAEKWDAKEACWDLAALAQDENVDAVYIASPNICHYEQVEMMLRAGKHVLCEKPIVPCEEQLHVLLRVAGEHGVLLLEAMRPAHLPVAEAVRKLLPKLGTLRYAEFPYAQYSSRYTSFQQGIVGNAFKPELCNGTLIDLGVYCAHWMAMLFGEPKKISALSSFFDGSIDTNGAALCDYGTMQVQLRYSKVHQSYAPAVIEGEEGCITLSPFPVPTHIELQLRGGEKTVVPVETEAHDMVYEIRHFMEWAKEPARAERYQQWTELSLRIMDTMREQTGIDFQRKAHP